MPYESMPPEEFKKTHSRSSASQREIKERKTKKLTKSKRVNDVCLAVGKEAGHCRRKRVGDEVVGESEDRGGVDGVVQSSVERGGVGGGNAGSGTESSGADGDLIVEVGDDTGRGSGNDCGVASCLEILEIQSILVERVDGRVDICAGVLPHVEAVHRGHESRVSLHGQGRVVFSRATEPAVRDSGKIEGELFLLRAFKSRSNHLVADTGKEPQAAVREPLPEGPGRGVPEEQEGVCARQDVRIPISFRETELSRLRAAYR